MKARVNQRPRGRDVLGEKLQGTQLYFRNKDHDTKKRLCDEVFVSLEIQIVEANQAQRPVQSHGEVCVCVCLGHEQKLRQLMLLATFSKIHFLLHDRLQIAIR